MGLKSKKEDGAATWSRSCGWKDRKGRQGALSSAAVPMLAALTASDKLLLFITGGGGWVAHIAMPWNMDRL